MEVARFKDVHPVLAVRDVEQAVGYYVERLGFRLAFRDRPAPSTYAGGRRDGVVLHLQWHDEADFKDVEAGGPLARVPPPDPPARLQGDPDKRALHVGRPVGETAGGARAR